MLLTTLQQKNIEGTIISNEVAKETIRREAEGNREEVEWEEWLSGELLFVPAGNACSAVITVGANQADGAKLLAGNPTGWVGLPGFFCHKNTTESIFGQTFRRPDLLFV